MHRQDCGYLGIQEEQCLQKGCCWNKAEKQSWCFYQGESKDAESFQSAYHYKLVEYGEEMMKMARKIFPTLKMSVKIPSVHWKVPKDTREAEKKAGLIISSSQDYEHFFSVAQT